MLRKCLILTAILFIIPVFYAQAQNAVTPVDHFGPGGRNIRWVTQFPPVDSERNPKLGQRMVDFLFGESGNETLIKPVAILPSDSVNYWILDQGNGAIYRVINQVGDMTHLIG